MMGTADEKLHHEFHCLVSRDGFRGSGDVDCHNLLFASVADQQRSRQLSEDKGQVSRSTIPLYIRLKSPIQGLSPTLAKQLCPIVVLMAYVGLRSILVTNRKFHVVYSDVHQAR